MKRFDHPFDRPLIATPEDFVRRFETVEEVEPPHGPVRTLKDMTAEEIAEIVRRYGPLTVGS